MLERMDDYGAFLLIYNLKIDDYLSILMTGPTCYSERARNKGKHPQIAYDRNTMLQLTITQPSFDITLLFSKHQSTKSPAKTKPKIDYE